MKIIKIFCLCFCFIVLITACNFSGSPVPSDTPTSGRINMAVDETFRTISQDELDVFHSLYKLAKITATYLPENEAFNLFLKDSLHLIIVSRPLKPQEKDYFAQKKLFPTETRIALDGVALIVHPSNKDTLITVNQFKKILNGELKSWNQLNSKSKLGKIQVVFDNPGSSTLRFLRDSVCGKDKLANTLTSLEKNSEVLKYVASTPNALGVIGVSWISDRDDSTQLSFLKKITVMAVSREDKATYENSYQPYQAYIAKNLYPFTRHIYAITSDPKAGLATGFISFLASERGQRIVLKAGILPSTQPLRIIEVNNNNF
jgi:phosphate transport system substrate-binding protein